jgi:hypothetical protein
MNRETDEHIVVIKRADAGTCQGELRVLWLFSLFQIKVYHRFMPLIDRGLEYSFIFRFATRQNCIGKTSEKARQGM